MGAPLRVSGAMEATAAAAVAAAAMDEFAGSSKPSAKTPSASQDEEAALQLLVEGNDDLEFNESGSKVKCKSTGHEMPMRLQVVEEYLKGGKYRKAREMYSNDFSKYPSHIVPHAKLKKHLFCQLTGTVLPMDPKKIKNHLNGKKYKDTVKDREEAEKKQEEKAALVAERRRIKREARLKRIAAGAPPPERKQKGTIVPRSTVKKKKQATKEKTETSQAVVVAATADDSAKKILRKRKIKPASTKAKKTKV